jgi:hypothetical protein
MKYQRASLLGALMQSFSANAMRRACFGDMKEFMKALTHDEEERFLNHIDSDAKAGAPWDETNSPEVADPVSGLFGLFGLTSITNSILEQYQELGHDQYQRSQVRIFALHFKSSTPNQRLSGSFLLRLITDVQNCSWI